MVRRVRHYVVVAFLELRRTFVMHRTMRLLLCSFGSFVS
jgi:hypothetical protein